MKIIDYKIDEFDDKRIFKKSIDRRGNIGNKPTHVLPVIFFRSIGIIGDKSMFYDRIFLLDEKLKKFGELYLKIDKGLDLNIDINLQKCMSSTIDSIDGINSRTPLFIARKIFNSNCFKHRHNIKEQELFEKGIKRIIEICRKHKACNTNENKLKNILIYNLFWFKKYIRNIIINYDFNIVNPKILFYGEINNREVYFLYFLNSIGFDIVYISSKESSVFTVIDLEFDIGTTIKSVLSSTLNTFPIEINSSAVNTETYEISEEVKDMIHGDDTGSYKPWQLKDYNVRSRVIRSTYDEIFILARENSVMREGWDSSMGIVTLPIFFSKILGIKNNRDEYFKNFNFLRKSDNTLYINKFPFFRDVPELLKIEYYTVLNDKGIIELSKLLQSVFWPYKHLQMYLQNLIGKTMINLYRFKGIKRQKLYSVEEQLIYIFSILMSLDESILKLIQTHDYPSCVPKIVLYNDGKSGEFVLVDSIKLLFLNKIGFDIFIFNPSGQNDIELFIEEDNYEKHQLENVSFNEDVRINSVFGKYIKEINVKNYFKMINK